MGKKIWIVGVLAAGLFAVSAMTGYSTDARAPELGAHLLVSVGSALLAFFCQLWVFLYLLTTDRLLRRTASRAGFAAEVFPTLNRLLTRALPVAVPTAVLVVIVVAMGAETYTGRISAATHQTLGWAALAAQVAALAIERGVLRRHEEVVREVDHRVSRGAIGLGT